MVGLNYALGVLHCLVAENVDGATTLNPAELQLETFRSRSR